ncbi:hypothetical protein E2562_035527 [Oryza meyeriana var. granulata]|uniref:Uncharacterized protein n=1 Tax=Oryza meyeriana var. granulata TaxID=110450 RepID=A0A6G1E7U0_9ORYZ|nr:hypothetical protein E2562_035527 [Oryza meyeriana var. granulata]
MVLSAEGHNFHSGYVIPLRAVASQLLHFPGSVTTSWMIQGEKLMLHEARMLVKFVREVVWSWTTTGALGGAVGDGIA